MTFNYTERVDFLHCIEVDTEDEELFEEIKEEFGEENVKFIKDTGGTVSEYEVD